MVMGQKGAMWMLQYETFLSHKKLGHVIQVGFDATLPNMEAAVLAVGTEDIKIKAK